MNVKDKIAKLLALSASPYEAEARAALLKARKLMAEHKLELSDIEEKQAQVVKISTGLWYGPRRNVWIGHLCSVIAANNCCRIYVQRPKSKQNQEVMIAGFSDDAEICKEICNYAVDCVLSGCQAIKRSLKNDSSQLRNTECNGYALGFIQGVEDAYAKQTEDIPEYGLVLVVPKEVNDALAGMQPGKKHTVQYSQNAYDSGYQDGLRFNPSGKLPENAKKREAS